MLDIGGWELLLIATIAVLVVGPRELPGLLRTVMLWVRRAREMAQEFRSGIDDIAREVELDKLRDEMERESGIGELRTIRDDLERDIDPTIGSDGVAELGSVEAESAAASAAEMVAPNDESPPDGSPTGSRTGPGTGREG